MCEGILSKLNPSLCTARDRVSLHRCCFTALCCRARGIGGMSYRMAEHKGKIPEINHQSTVLSHQPSPPIGQGMGSTLRKY